MISLSVVFMTAPGSGNNTSGKFYIAVPEDAVPITIHGANSASGSGQVKRWPSRASVQKKIREKSKEYTEVAASAINDAAIKNLLDQIEAKLGPGYPASRASFDSTSQKIVYAGQGKTGTNAPQPQEKASISRPRAHPQKLGDIWF